MLKSKVSYSINPDDFIMGVEVAEKTNQELDDIKLNFLYTSANNDIKKIVKGMQSVTNTPIIGCTSSGGIIVPEGYITSDSGFAGTMSLSDPDMTIGIACHEAGRDARAIGRKVAIAAVENAKTTRAPAYFYMVATPKEEEEYLMGIQDVIGRVPVFGGSAADDRVEGKWKIICNDKVLDDGVAVAFFYTDNEINTSFVGGYKETDNMGLITKVKNSRTLVTIDGISALKKYAHWINVSPLKLKEQNILFTSVTKPLGIKDPLGNLVVVRHPMFGNDMGTKTTTDDTITLGNKVVEGTAIIQLEATVNDLIETAGTAVRDLKKKMYNNPAAYLLFHCGGRRFEIGNRVDEVYNNILKECHGVPFLVAFTFGEYGYEEHSSNICGGLMLSYTCFGKK